MDAPIEVGEFAVVCDPILGEVGVIASGDRYREVPREVVDALVQAYARLDSGNTGGRS